MRTRTYKKTIIAILLLIFMCSCKQSGESENRLVYGLTLNPSGIDPHIYASSELGIPLRSVYDSLIFREPLTGEFVPGLAETWQISEDGLVYTFSLREDVKFHDGSTFNAEAVSVNLERIMASETNSLKARDLLGPLTGIEIHNDYSISLILSSPFEPFLDGLSQPYIGMASPTALNHYDTSTYQFHQVGTGPYVFVEYNINENILLKRNNEYSWGPEFASQAGVTPVEYIEFKFFTDPGSRSLAIQAGDVSVMGELLPIDAISLTEQGVVNILPSEIPGQPIQLLLNTERIPTNDINVRKALIHATNRIDIAKTIYQGYASPAFAPVTSKTAFHNSSLEDAYIFDPVQANLLFDSTGWVDSDGDGWRDRDGESLDIILVIPPWNQMPDIAELIKQQWESILHIKVIVRQVASFPMLVNQASKGEYNGIGIYFAGYDPSFLDTFYRTGERLNWSRVSNYELDLLLSNALVEHDQERRSSLYIESQKIIMDEALCLPLIEPVNLNAYNPEITGLRFDITGWFPLLFSITFQ